MFYNIGMTERQDQFQKQLTEACVTVGIALSVAQVSRFRAYARELMEWNGKTNLLGPVDLETLTIKHFVDCLAVLRATTPAGRVVDIGSGGGFPGVPLKIAAPGFSLTLVEATRKKASFLRHILGVLDLRDSEVFNGRIEALPLDAPGFDMALSRGFADMERYCRVALPVVRPGGRIVYLGGRRVDARMLDRVCERGRVQLENRFRFELPEGKGLRNIIVFQKCST